jgi:hypothetical protein
MFIPRGVFVTMVKNWRATPPSTRRGTSTCPREPRSRMSLSQSSVSACRSATNSRPCSSRARAEVAYGGACSVVLAQRSTSPGRTKKNNAPPAATTARSAMSSFLFIKVFLIFDF